MSQQMHMPMDLCKTASRRTLVANASMMCDIHTRNNNNTAPSCQGSAVSIQHVCLFVCASEREYAYAEMRVRVYVCGVCVLLVGVRVFSVEFLFPKNWHFIIVKKKTKSSWNPVTQIKKWPKWSFLFDSFVYFFRWNFTVSLCPYHFSIQYNLST